MRTIEQMVQSEVLCCMSHVVHTLALGYNTMQPCRFANGVSQDGKEAQSLMEQAFELSCPIPDYEEAAIQAGWVSRPATVTDGVPSDPCVVRGTTADDAEYSAGFKYAENWQEACEADDIEPYDREVFEHWAVTRWFADKLIEHGEKVDTDFGNLCVWARTTTGQCIASDSVVERIYADMMKA